MSPRRRGRGFGLLRALAAAAVLAGLAADDAAAEPVYIGSEACTDCHEAAAEAWAGSHHALAWTRPSPRTVRADFDGTRFEGTGMTVAFRREAEAYLAEVTESDGRTTEYRVHSVVGVEPLQQYLLETDPGRLQSFDVVWDTAQERWFHLYPEEPLPPGDGLHWTGPYKTWNGRCASCHATGYEKAYDPATRRYASTEAEIGVGCEACHGPGSAHVAWAEHGTAPPEGLTPAGLTADTEAPKAWLDICAGCHSRREALDDGNPLPGTAFHDVFRLALLRPGLYHADGQILDEVYVTGSFLQSRMHAAGVGCSDCHDAHSARRRAEGNALCTQCHSPAGNPSFPTLRAGLYDDPAHHFHEPGTPGAACKSCHMIERIYMGVDGRRDHSFRVPRPDLAAETGGPDACTDCHVDRSPAWAADRIARWYPDSHHRGAHYATALAAARRDAAAAAPALVGLARDETQPGIVRATALWHLGRSGDAAAAGRVADLLDDADPLIRHAAVGAQRAAPPIERVQRVVGLLDDPVRTVRIAAARMMLGAPVAHLPGRMARDLSAAMAEWQEALGSRLDFPETHLALGGAALSMRSAAAARAAFREAVTLDAQRVEGWVMLARIAAATEGEAATRAVLGEALARNPADAVLGGMLHSLEGASQD